MGRGGGGGVSQTFGSDFSKNYELQTENEAICWSSVVITAFKRLNLLHF